MFNLPLELQTCAHSWNVINLSLRLSVDTIEFLNTNFPITAPSMCNLLAKSVPAHFFRNGLL